jgi:hypothetical protein
MKVVLVLGTVTAELNAELEGINIEKATIITGSQRVEVLVTVPAAACYCCVVESKEFQIAVGSG